MYRAWGYSLTGSVREHALFFGHGEGKNGKTTTIMVVKTIAGDYAVFSPMEMFTYRKHSEHPTELADLFGARLVIAVETEQGKGWNETRLKNLTGGEPVKARRMRENYWSFSPTHKLWFFGNHRPQLRETGEAMRRRMNLIPFTVTIAQEQINKSMEQNLLGEAQGILAKLVAGCVEWQRQGLNPPEKIIAATDKYMEEEDYLKQWFEECIELGTRDNGESGALTAVLYESYSRWMRRSGGYPLRQAQFVEELDRRSEKFGIKRAKDKITVGGPQGERGRGFLGIKTVTVQDIF